MTDRERLDLAAISAELTSVVTPADRWPFLVSAVERLSAADTIDDVIRVVRETARTISGADGVTFVLRDGNLCHYVEEDAVGPLWKGRRFPMSSCISGWCMLNKKAAIVPDIYVDPRIPHDAYRPTFVKSLVMVPVRAENPLAAIGSYWGACREFSDGEIALLEGLARSTAAAIAAVQAKETLRENEERLRMALAAGRLGAWELNFASGAFKASAVCRAHFGRGPDNAFSYGDLVQAIHPDDRRRQEVAFTEAREARSDLSIEFRTAGPDGDVRWIEMRGRVVCDVNDAPSRMTGVSLDISERKQSKDRIERLQSELAHVGRLSELGHMSSAFAHELVQPLSAANNYLNAARHLLHASGPYPEGVLDAIDKADAQFVRAKQIIQRIRGFVGKGQSARAAEDLKSLIEEASQIALIDPKHRNVELQLAIDDDLPPVVVDKVQIQQVLLNLLRNAFEAIEEASLQQVTVSAMRTRPGNMVEVRVRDSGPGLSPSVAARLFEPFFTTKTSGMGVGLSICRQILEDHGGKLWADTSHEPGAVFSFTVPVGAQS
jgi:signal transduction histidine kinase